MHWIFFLLLIFAAPWAAHADCAPDADIRLQVLGSGGPEISDQRASSGYILWQNGRGVVIVDTGSGTAANFERTTANLNDLQAILFTHFHVDHSVDFPTFIKASYFTGRETDLKVYGPAGNSLMPSATTFVADLIGANGAYRYLDNVLVTDKASNYKVRVTDVPLSPVKTHRYRLNSHITLSATPVQHGPVSAVAWRVDIDGCAITFSGDMNNHYNTLTGLARNSDILVATNAIPEGTTGVARFLHMPPSEIGKIAATAHIRTLVLSHRMLRTLGRETETRKTIRQFYSGPIRFADDLDQFSVNTEIPGK